MPDGIEIPILEMSDVKTRSRCGKTKSEKYGAYLRAVDESLITWIFENIDASPTGKLLIKVVDMAKQLGPEFEQLKETSIFWGLKFALWHHGISCSTTTHKEINPVTRKHYMIIIMRRSKAGDKLPDSLASDLEPAPDEMPEPEKESEPLVQCI